MDKDIFREEISFNNIYVDVIWKCSGIFTGANMQPEWSSSRDKVSAFGTILGDMNTFDHPVNILAGPDASGDSLAALQVFWEGGTYVW
ncbi:MAG: hypothetical protein ACM3TR_11020 [Caulobacteraceae bacterium]